MEFKHVLIVSLIAVAVIFTAGCLSFGHDEADRVYVDDGYYWFEDDNGRSFNKTLYEGDLSNVPRQFSPQGWINYVQSLDYIEDENDMEIFYNASETVARHGGDCEDLSILMARGLHEMGFDTAIIIQPEHVLSGINVTQANTGYKGIKILPNYRSKNYRGVNVGGYYALESTARWSIGEYDEYPLEYEKIMKV